MALLSAFNPHELKADTVLKVATGRAEPLARLLDIIRSNLTAPTKQHVIVSAPRGYGKSFLLRYVQVTIEEIAKREGLPIAMALLSEELPHVKEPDTLLAEIRRTFLGEPANTVGVRWAEDDGEAWYQSVADLDSAVAERLGSNGLLVAGVENFDLLVRKAFAKDIHGGSLREFLTRKNNRVMLLAASARGAFDRDYDRPLFKAFEEIALEPWSVDECVAFFRAQRAAAGKVPLTDVQEAKARAVATFIGGTPRLATLIGETLLEDDPVRAADLLDKLVDELTPYYKERIEVLPNRSQALLDGLLRGGERCSATELARRVGAPNQPAIAAPLDELRKDLVVVGDKAPDSAEMLLRVTDRVFAHYYRKRILSHGQETCPLEALVDLLAVYYSPEEQKREAEKLKARGLAREAAIMERLWQAGERDASATLDSKLNEQRDPVFSKKMDEWRRLTNKMRFADGLLILDDILTAARAAGNYDVEAEAVAQRGWTLAELNRYEEALTTAREASALAERAKNGKLKAYAIREAAFCMSMLGRNEEAIRIAREAAALAGQAGDVTEQANALAVVAYGFRELGRHEEALGIARESVALAKSVDAVDEQANALRIVALCLEDLKREEEAVAPGCEAADLMDKTDNIALRRHIARLVLGFRGSIGVDRALSLYESLIGFDAPEQDEDAALWFDDVAHVVTAASAWPRLVLLLERFPKSAELLVKNSHGLGVAGFVIAAAHAANQHDAALSQARHFVAALAQAMDTVTHRALTELWMAVLNASVERIATTLEDAAFLSEFGDILVAYVAVPGRAKILIAAAAAYHAGGRDPAALARLEPDLATTLMAVFPPKAAAVKQGRKPRVRRKR